MSGPASHHAAAGELNIEWYDVMQRRWAGAKAAGGAQVALTAPFRGLAVVRVSR